MQANFQLLTRGSAIIGGLQLPFTQCQTPNNIVCHHMPVLVQFNASAVHYISLQWQYSSVFVKSNVIAVQCQLSSKPV